MRRAPVWITLGVGWFLVADYFIPHQRVSDVGQRITQWVPIVASVGLALGAVSLFQLHSRRILSRHPHRLYSAVTLVSMLATVLAGLWPGRRGEPVFAWLYERVLVPSRATMFSLLAFYLASAAYRAFRVRGRESLFLFLAAFVVMLGNVPMLTGWIPGLAGLSAWVLDVPMTAAMRAIRIGVGLGLILLSLRILLGKDRSYLGAEP